MAKQNWLKFTTWLNQQSNEPMSSKYKQHNVIKIQTYKHNVIKIRKVKNKSYTTTTSNPIVGPGLADAAVAASSTSGLASWSRLARSAP